MFRKVVPYGLVPWTKTSPMAHRYLLASILLGYDMDAWDALEEMRGHVDFLGSPELGIRCARILELSPTDAETLTIMTKLR